MNTSTEDLGKISSEFRISQNKIKGIILADTQAGKDIVSENLGGFIKEVLETGIQDTDIRVQTHSDIKEGMFKTENNDTKNRE